MIKLNKTKALQWQNEALTVKGQSLFLYQRSAHWSFLFCVRYNQSNKKRLISEVDENEKSLIELQKQTVNIKMLYQGLMEFTEMKQLTPTVVKKLIERIEIHNNEKQHSHNNVKVDINFTAVGLFDILTEQQLIDIMERVKQKKAEKSA